MTMADEEDDSKSRRLMKMDDDGGERSQLKQVSPAEFEKVVSKRFVLEAVAKFDRDCFLILRR